MKYAVASAILALGLLPSSSSLGQTVFSTDFEAGLPVEFSGAGTVTGTEGYSGFGFDQNYLRNDTAGNPASATTLTLGGLPVHTHVFISFDLAVIDSWDGDTVAGGTVPPDLFNVDVDGASAFSETFDNFIAGDQTYLGPATVLRVLSLAQNGGWADSAYPVSITLPHVANSIVVDWFASGGGWQAGADESWAIDNLTVTLRNTGVIPEAQNVVAGVGMVLIGGFVAWRRRRQ